MRGPTKYETYLDRMRSYYTIKHMEQPAWIELADQYYHRLFYAKEDFSAICHGANISKKTMKWLSELPSDHLEKLPVELVDSIQKQNDHLFAMYTELIEGKEEYFIREWTLSKKERRKMREYVDTIPCSARSIMPPQNQFTNVPDSISFSNRVYDFEAEYELCVAFSGSGICLRNGDTDSRNTKYVEFTEQFLDKAIPLMQKERIEGLLISKDRSEGRDESIYQDF